MAIDVNSGNFRTDDTAEETAFQLNLLAAKEIARQLRLRDLGGVIVNDFIDMRKERHRRDVERTLRDAVKRDRARTKILRTSPFGLIEMTRQRIRPSLKRSVYKDCPGCTGTRRGEDRPRAWRSKSSASCCCGATSSRWLEGHRHRGRRSGQLPEQQEAPRAGQDRGRATTSRSRSSAAKASRPST